MTRVETEVHIDADAQEVWHVLADFGNVYRFNPTVSGSHSTSEQSSGVGATRHCDLTMAGASIEERVIEWVDGEEFRVEIYEGRRTPPAKRITARMGVVPDDVGSVASMEIDYELKGGVLGALMDRLIVRRQYAATVEKVLDGLKRFVESGESARRSSMPGRSEGT